MCKHLVPSEIMKNYISRRVFKGLGWIKNIMVDNMSEFFHKKQFRDIPHIDEFRDDAKGVKH